MSVKILIKSPTQQIEDFEFSCDLTWTIAKLKDHLSIEYPMKPEHNQQKIIYCGRVLLDHQQLKDIVIKGVDVHTMHLVCPMLANVNHSPPTVAEEQAKHPSNESSSPVNVAPTFNDDGLRQRGWSSYPNQFNMNTPYAGQLPPGGAMPVASPYMAYQMAMAQQAYAQMMTQFLSQSQLGQAYPQPLYNNVPDSPDNVDNLSPDQAQPQANQQINNDQHPPLDLLDYFHFFTRFLVLVAVIYFYSSLSKVLLVICLGLLFYVLRRHQQRTPQPVYEAPETQNVPASESQANDNEENTNEPRAQPENQGPFERLVTRVIIPFFTGVKIFFTSLIPEQLPVEA